MQDDNYINLMDDQQILKYVEDSIIISKKNVIVKLNDNGNKQLDVLKANQNQDIHTTTPTANWLTFEFMRKEKLLKIEGTFYYKDNRIFSYECEYLDSKKQWTPLVKEECLKNLNLSFNPKISAFGIRFKGKSNKSEFLHFNNLNIFAYAKKPYLVDQAPQNEVVNTQDKTKLVNIMEHQPFYRNLNDTLIVCMRPAISCKSNESKWAIEDIISNTNQEIYQFSSSQNWLTYEFARKYKLSQIQIQMYEVDQRTTSFELQVLDQQKNWISVEEDQNRYKNINIQFINLKPAYGIRIKGTGTCQNLRIISLTILAQRGSPQYL